MRLLYIIISSFLFASCAMAPVKSQKIKGVSFVASRNPINNQHIKPVMEINANFAAIMPFGFIKSLDHPEIIFNTERQWFGETKIGVSQYIETLKNESLKIMLKPQIWVWKGEFTGNIKMNDENNWKLLESSYSNFILEYAELAQKMNVDIFCIGTELEQFVLNRQDYWMSLIKEIRKVYNGALTYAANWNEFESSPFWDQLNYIGIDAYFPISDKQSPALEDCMLGWDKHKNLLESYSIKYDKPILFTEYGYRSVDYTAKEPWRSDRNMINVNLDGQRNATHALFETFWKEEWFAGGFVWKWFHDHETAGGEQDSRFTPQNKPAEEIIKVYYSK